MDEIRNAEKNQDIIAHTAAHRFTNRRLRTRPDWRTKPATVPSALRSKAIVPTSALASSCLVTDSSDGSVPRFSNRLEG